MKKSILIVVSVVLGVIALALVLSSKQKEWKGVDDTVVEKFAREAGHPAWRPFIDTDKGDLLLFCFLVAGACGGFLAGYHFRDLFPPRIQPGEKESPQM